VNANENAKMNTIGRSRPAEHFDYFARNQNSFADTLSMGRFIPRDRLGAFSAGISGALCVTPCDCIELAPSASSANTWVWILCSSLGCGALRRRFRHYKRFDERASINARRILSESPPGPQLKFAWKIE
jgi:hypothetical protein